MSAVFYSLYGLGCRPHGLNPKVTAFIYKQFAQVIFRHGLDMLQISVSQQKVKAHVHSFINQLGIVNKKTKMIDCIADTKNTIVIINNLKTSEYKNIGLIESIDFVIDF